jgi:nicotinamidase-related amidase
LDHFFLRDNNLFFFPDHPSILRMEETALLIMDVQTGTVSSVPVPQTYLPLMSDTINTARSAGVKIIYIVVSFRPSHPECSPCNSIFGQLAKSNAYVATAPETVIHPSIAPRSTDIVVEKKRVSAFVGSDLDVVLRSLGVKKLVMAGLITSGVVLSTACEAADRDFEIVVLRDLCVDFEEETHRVLMDSVFAKRGKVVVASEWIEDLTACKAESR